MNFLINDRLRDFFLGDNAGWDDIVGSFYDPMLKRLAGRFSNLSVVEIEDVISDWVTEIYVRIAEERNRAEAEGKTEELSDTEIQAKKIEYCTDRMGFDFDKPFENWLSVILKNKAIDYCRKVNRRSEIDVDPENSIEPDDRWDGAQKIEFPLLMKEFKKNMSAALGDNELLYFRIWFEHGEHPSAEIVRRAFTENFNKDYSNAAITIIKQRFVRVCYLTLLRIEYDVGLLKDRFRRAINSEEDENTFFEDMMQIIWKSFYEDTASRETSRGEISPALWREWERLVQRKRVQNRILVEAYRYFRAKNLRPGFCRVIEIYAKDRFGKKLTDLFFESETNKENE